MEFRQRALACSVALGVVTAGLATLPVAAAETTAQTGVEMEALTAVAVAALTVYDMAKAVDKAMRIEGVELVSKTKEPV